MRFVFIMGLGLLIAGCGHQQEPFVGKWTADFDAMHTNQTEHLVFRPDGTGTQELIVYTPYGDATYSDQFSWHKDSNNLVFIYKATDGQSKHHDYSDGAAVSRSWSVSDDSKTLTITDADGAKVFTPAP